MVNNSVRLIFLSDPFSQKNDKFFLFFLSAPKEQTY